VLLKYGVKHDGNSSGNTPLHWAVQNKVGPLLLNQNLTMHSPPKKGG
jgi:hypothetical protein